MLLLRAAGNNHVRWQPIVRQSCLMATATTRLLRLHRMSVLALAVRAYGQTGWYRLSKSRLPLAMLR